MKTIITLALVIAMAIAVAVMPTPAVGSAAPAVAVEVLESGTSRTDRVRGFCGITRKYGIQSGAWKPWQRRYRATVTLWRRGTSKPWVYRGNGVGHRRKAKAAIKQALRAQRQAEAADRHAKLAAKRAKLASWREKRAEIAALITADEQAKAALRREKRAAQRAAAHANQAWVAAHAAATPKEAGAQFAQALRAKLNKEAKAAAAAEAARLRQEKEEALAKAAKINFFNWMASQAKDVIQWQLNHNHLDLHQVVMELSRIRRRPYRFLYACALEGLRKFNQQELAEAKSRRRLLFDSLYLERGEREYQKAGYKAIRARKEAI